MLGDYAAAPFIFFAKGQRLDTGRSKTNRVASDAGK
jgi:hypothetical protein